jgi:hypothetical protein
MFFVEEIDRKSSLQNDLHGSFIPYVQEICSEQRIAKGETTIFSAGVLVRVARSQGNNTFTYYKNITHKKLKSE